MPHSEGLANHTDPESCGVDGNVVSEALTGECAGRVSSFEKGEIVPGADVLLTIGRPHPEHRPRKAFGNPAESKTPCMHGNALHGTREILPPSPRHRGPPRKSERSTPGMHGDRKSDSLVVPEGFRPEGTPWEVRSGASP